VIVALSVAAAAAAFAGVPEPPYNWSYDGLLDSGTGTSVAAAGDVNGDGFSDVVIGGPGNSQNGIDAGRIDVFFGGPGGLTHHRAKTGTQAGAKFGMVVSSAGDINGDGYDEILVASPDYGNGHTREGKVELYLGGPGGIADSPSWTVESGQTDAAFGLSVAGIGDVNGDGLDDVAVGAPRYDNGSTDEGRVFVYYGAHNGLSTTASVVRESNTAGAWFGACVAWGGDLNGDGFDDMVVGMPRWSNGQSGEGAACVYLGSANGLGALPIWLDESDQANAYFGAAVSGIGDVDGDGYGDLAVGAMFHDGGHSNEGRVSVYRGSAGGPLATPSWTFESDQTAAAFGNSVAPAGDFDGDGYADLMIGAFTYDGGETDEGLMRVYLGSATGLSGTSYINHTCGQQGARLGHCVSGAGDINGDGLSDILAGAPLHDGLGEDTGRAMAWFGKPRLHKITASWMFTAQQGSYGNRTLRGVFADWNADGYEDLTLGDGNDDNNNGSVRVFYGAKNGLPASPDWVIHGDGPFGGLGSSLASAGDVDGDGYADLLVGSPGMIIGGEYRGIGEVRLYRGSANGLAPAPSHVLHGDNDTGFGFAVAGAGDLNGDGFADVLIGAPFNDNGLHRGRVFVYFGSPGGLPDDPSLSVENPIISTGRFGWSVSGIGDINGDGFDDWAAGAPFAGDRDGRVDFFRGDSSPDGQTDGYISGSVDNGFFGFAVTGIGDVDSDGRSDFAVGAPATWNTYMGTGKVLIYRLEQNNQPAQIWSLSGETLGDGFGSSLAAAGDVNGDGKGDLLVGAPYYDGLDVPQQNKGRAYLYPAPFNGWTRATWTITGVWSTDRVGHCLIGRGDLNGDGHLDLALGISASQSNPLPRVRAYHGSHPSGVDRRVRQLRPDAATPIALGGGAFPDGFRLQGNARHPMGREYISTQVELEAAGTPFDGQDLIQGGWADTGTPAPGHGSTYVFSHHLWNLPAGLTYHWRLRLRSGSRWAPYSRWMTLAGNDSNEGDVRVLDAPNSGAPDQEYAAAFGLTLEGSNPTRGAAVLGFRLPRAGEITLRVFDANGRSLRTLAEGRYEAGSHRQAWDLRDEGGDRIASGVYFARLDWAGVTQTRRVVVID